MNANASPKSVMGMVKDDASISDEIDIKNTSSSSCDEENDESFVMHIVVYPFASKRTDIIRPSDFFYQKYIPHLPEQTLKQQMEQENEWVYGICNHLIDYISNDGTVQEAVADGRKWESVIILVWCILMDLSESYDDYMPSILCFSILIGIITTFVLANIYSGNSKIITTTNYGTNIGVASTHATTIIFIISTMRNCIHGIIVRHVPFCLLFDLVILYLHDREWYQYIHAVSSPIYLIAVAILFYAVRVLLTIKYHRLDLGEIAFYKIFHYIESFGSGRDHESKLKYYTLRPVLVPGIAYSIAVAVYIRKEAFKSPVSKVNDITDGKRTKNSIHPHDHSSGPLLSHAASSRALTCPFLTANTTTTSNM